MYGQDVQNIHMQKYQIITNIVLSYGTINVTSLKTNNHINIITNS